MTFDVRLRDVLLASCLPSADAGRDRMRQVKTHIHMWFPYIFSPSGRGKKCNMRNSALWAGVYNVLSNGLHVQVSAEIACGMCHSSSWRSSKERARRQSVARLGKRKKLNASVAVLSYVLGTFFFVFCFTDGAFLVSFVPVPSLDVRSPLYFVAFSIRFLPGGAAVVSLFQDACISCMTCGESF